MNRGAARNCTFINNSATRYGGAISVTDIENCTFINNSAPEGGAINCFSNVKDSIFINNSEDAIKFQESATVLNCKFINNKDGVNSKSYLSSTIINCTFMYNKRSGYVQNAFNCTFINNYGSFTGDAVKCNFINNFAEFGALRGGTAINCSFINNSATNGGAIFFADAINCSFVNNSASLQGGAIYGSKDIINCSFVNNSATCGGAIYGKYYIPGTYNQYINSLIEHCTFVNNSATYGGAIYYGDVIDSTFDNNSASYGGAVYIEKYSNFSNLTNCNFTNCHAEYQGGAIYLSQNAHITYCSFSNCTSGDDSCLAFNSSNVDDYLVQDCKFDKYPNNIEYHYVSSLIADNLTYFKGEDGILLVKLYDVRGVLSNKIITLTINKMKYNATTDSNGSAIFDIESYSIESGIYNCSVGFQGDSIINPTLNNITVSINKHIAILNVSDLILFKNEFGNLIANLSNIRGPLSNKPIIFTVNNRTRSITTNENGLAEFNIVNFVSDKGEYVVGVTFKGDECNHPVSTNVSFIYVDYKGILTGRVDGKYYNDTILTFNLINYRNNKPINGETIKLSFSNGETVYLKTDVDGNANYRIPYVPDYYDVVACVDGDFISVNNVSFKEIEISKIFGEIEHSLLNGNKTIQFKLYHRSNHDALRNIRLKLIFNNGEEVEIISDDNGIANYNIPFPKGTYSVSVTVIGDYKDFEPNPEYISNIVVSNDLNCSVNFTNNITFDFGEYGSTNYTVDGGYIDSNHISVIDHPEAIISINNNTITVFGLAVGNYTLLVETIPDDYHNPINATLNVTVNTVKSKVTFSAGVSFEYGGSASIYVTVEGGTVNGKSIQILGHPEAKITFIKNMITVSGLNPGTYTLRVESIPDSDHKAGEGTVGITVRKATAVIKASKLTVALKSGALWTIKIIDSKTKKPISNMKVTLKVYTGNKYKTVTLNTNSKGEANYQTRSLTKGNHRIVVSATHNGYNFNTLTSSINVIKPTKLSFKVKKNIAKDGSSLSITVKKGKKPINGIKIKLLVYTGKKYKTVVLKSKTKGKYKGVCGWGTNKIGVGSHKVVIKPVSIKYSGSKTVKMNIKKSAKKYPNWETKI